MKRFLFTLSASLIVSMALVGWAKEALPAPAEKWPAQIAIGSFMKGSTIYPINVALAKLVGKYSPAMGVVREYAGGAPGMDALARGNIDTWGIGQNDFYNAYYGTGFWKGKPQNVKLIIGNWFVGPHGYGVRPGSGIKSLKDLAGKRCLVKSGLPYVNTMVEAQMRHAGVWDKAVILQMAATGEIAPAMIDKKIDCFFKAIGASFTLQIKQAVGLDWISLTPEEQEAGLRVTPGEVAWTAPPYILKMYDYPPDKVLRSVAYVTGVGVRSDIPDFVAYGILAAIYDGNHLDEVRHLSKHLTDASIEKAVEKFWIPFHPGAVKYYKDRGVWTKETEARQKELLDKTR